MIEVKNLVKKYGDHTAVDHLSFHVDKGQIYGFLGPNGAGKSTTMNIMTGYIASTSGEVLIDGHNILEEPEAAKKCIGYLPEQPPLYFDMTVAEYLKFAAELKKVPKNERETQIEQVMELTGITAMANRLIKNLSKGYKQRVGLAQAILGYPEIIILDEPTVAVDPQSRNKILEGIMELNRNGATIVYTSHYMEEVEQICSRIAIMDGGKNLALGTASELKKLIKNTETINIELLNLPDEIMDEIKNLPHVYNITYNNNILKIFYSGGKHNLIRVLDLLKSHNINMGRVYSEFPTLNDVFLEITGKELRD